MGRIIQMRYTADDYTDALDILHRSQQHIGMQFSVKMPRDIAVAHFEARTIIAKCQELILAEAESIFYTEAVDHPVIGVFHG